jgi:hypothetical protein
MRSRCVCRPVPSREEVVRRSLAVTGRSAAKRRPIRPPRSESGVCSGDQPVELRDAGAVLSMLPLTELESSLLIARVGPAYAGFLLRIRLATRR